MFGKFLIGLLLFTGSIFFASGGDENSEKVRREVATDQEMETKNKCKCVKYFLCDQDNYIITNGETLIDERNSFGDYNVHNLICSELDEGIVQYCCYHKPEDIVDRSDPTLISNPGESSQKCGRRRVPDSAIGAEAQEDEYPWMAAVYVKNHFVCTGALIHPNVVLTAAHYVYRVKDKANLKVFVGGGVNVKSITNEQRKVVEYLKHPDYIPNGLLYNDIALLILDQPYTLNDHVNVLCLPMPSLTFENIRCETSGWNRNDPSTLHKVSLPFVNHDQCQTMLQTNTELGPKFVLHDSFVCAGGEKGKDACKGDGGSPLMCKSGEEFYHVGIVSWGKGCNQENVPGAYTNVAKYQEWIYSELFKRNIIII